MAQIQAASAAKAQVKRKARAKLKAQVKRKARAKLKAQVKRKAHAKRKAQFKHKNPQQVKSPERFFFAAFFFPKKKARTPVTSADPGDAPYVWAETASRSVRVQLNPRYTLRAPQTG